MLAQHRDLLFLGEDIEDGNEFTPGPYGGAFKVSRGLSREYPGRVRNTPISEAGFTGLAVGRALAGKKTLVEIMFGDFCTLIVDQLLQHADKFPTMYGTDIALPLMIRTPMGGRRGYGPTHSQSIERLFLGMQNLVVLAVNHRLDVPAFYSAAFNGPPRPIFMIENKVLYTIANTAICPKGYVVEQSDEHFPTIRIKPARHPATCSGVALGTVQRVAAAMRALSTDKATNRSPREARPALSAMSSCPKLKRLTIGPSCLAIFGENGFYFPIGCKVPAGHGCKRLVDDGSLSPGRRGGCPPRPPQTGRAGFPHPVPHA